MYLCWKCHPHPLTTSATEWERKTYLKYKTAFWNHYLFYNWNARTGCPGLCEKWPDHGKVRPRRHLTLIIFSTSPDALFRDPAFPLKTGIPVQEAKSVCLGPNYWWVRRFFPTSSRMYSSVPIYIYIYQMDCVCQRCHKECSTRTCADDCYNCWKKSKLKSYVRPWFHG